jgi:hypothetical protein
MICWELKLCRNIRVGDTSVQCRHSSSRGTTTSGKDVSDGDIPSECKKNEGQISNHGYSVLLPLTR